MSAEPSSLDLLGPARAVLAELRTRLTSLGASVDPALALRAVPGLLSHYDLHERCIYIGVNDPARPESRLMVAYLASVLGLERAPLARLFEVLTPWTVAHELAHHLRHDAGLFGPDLLLEEILAHRFACAFARSSRHFRPNEALDLLSRAPALAGHDRTAFESGLNGVASPSVFGDQRSDGPAASLRQHMIWVREMLERPTWDSMQDSLLALRDLSHTFAGA